MRDTKIIELPKIQDPRGNLSFIEGNKHIPFEIKRIYWIYDVVLNDGNKEKIYSLNRSYYGLYVPQMIWRSLENFSTNSLCLILASRKYDETDYIRNFEEFKKLCNGML